MSNAYLEEFEVRSKVSKNGKWPVISSFQKWQVFGPISTWLSNIKEASNDFLSNMKVEDISLSHFQKVQDHEYLMNGWGDMIQSLPSVHGTSKGHNFWFITPNLVPLFLNCLSWHEVSKPFITLHEFPSYDHLLFHAYFGGNFENLKLVHHIMKQGSHSTLIRGSGVLQTEGHHSITKYLKAFDQINSPIFVIFTPNYEVLILPLWWYVGNGFIHSNNKICKYNLFSSHPSNLFAQTFSQIPTYNTYLQKGFP